MRPAHFPENHLITSPLEPTTRPEPREFSDGDAPVNAHPEFREQLRERLWTLLSARRANHTPDD